METRSTWSAIAQRGLLLLAAALPIVSIFVPWVYHYLPLHNPQDPLTRRLSRTVSRGISGQGIWIYGNIIAAATAATPYGSMWPSILGRRSCWRSWRCGTS